jgi:acylphosphatase
MLSGYSGLPGHRNFLSCGPVAERFTLADDITSLRVHVKGFVQGVGFRDFLAGAAQHNKLDGWVRNRSDGSVEALVSGGTKAVEAFVAAAMRGPHGAKVEHVDLHNSEPPSEKGFNRRPST